MGFKSAKTFSFILTLCLILITSSSALATISGPAVVIEDTLNTWTTTLKPTGMEVQAVVYTWYFGGPGGGTYLGPSMTTCPHSWDTPRAPKPNHIRVKLFYTTLVPNPALDPPLIRVPIIKNDSYSVIVTDITAPGQEDGLTIEGLPPTMAMACGEAWKNDILVNITDNNPTYLPGDWKVELYYQIGGHDFYTGSDGKKVFQLGPYPCNYAYSDIPGNPSTYYATSPMASDDPYYDPADPRPDPSAPMRYRESASADFPDGDCCWVGPIALGDPKKLGSSTPKTLTIQWRLEAGRILAPLKHADTASDYRPLKLFIKAVDHSGNCVTSGYASALTAAGGGWTSNLEIKDICPPWLMIEVISHSTNFREPFGLWNKTRDRFCNFDDLWEAPDNYLDNPFDQNSSNSFQLTLDHNVAEDTRIIFHPFASDNVDQAPLGDLVSLQKTGVESGTDPATAIFSVVNASTGEMVTEEKGRTDFPASVIFRDPGKFKVHWEIADKAGNSRAMELNLEILDTRMNVNTIQQK